jgi:hypothetical protein
MLQSGIPPPLTGLFHRPMHRFLPILLVLGLGACQPLPQQQATDLRADLMPRSTDSPPESPPEICWVPDTLPAVIETVTEQILVEPEQRNAEGGVIRPAVFRTETRQQIVSDRRDVWVRTPCPAEQTPTFIASLQRALKARGFYLEPVTGVLDGATSAAIRRFQAQWGLDSPVLTLETARMLGIVAADLGQRSGEPSSGTLLAEGAQP